MGGGKKIPTISSFKNCGFSETLEEKIFRCLKVGNAWEDTQKNEGCENWVHVMIFEFLTRIPLPIHIVLLAVDSYSPPSHQSENSIN